LSTTVTRSMAGLSPSCPNIGHLASLAPSRSSTGTASSCGSQPPPPRALAIVRPSPPAATFNRRQQRTQPARRHPAVRPGLAHHQEDPVPRRAARVGLNAGREVGVNEHRAGEWLPIDEADSLAAVPVLTRKLALPAPKNRVEGWSVFPHREGCQERLGKRVDDAIM
jgi:hypothetical protein